MTTPVVTVDRITPYQEIDRLLTQHKISGMPVLKMGREVAGVVSEADLLAAEHQPSRQARMASSAGRRRRLRRQPHVNWPSGLSACSSPPAKSGVARAVPGRHRCRSSRQTWTSPCAKPPDRRPGADHTAVRRA